MTIDAGAFAGEWIAAWNGHDIDRILSHYAEDAVLHSPIAARRMGEGRLVGRDRLRGYWSAGLAALPNLHFTLEAALTGHDAVTILYRNQDGIRVAETCEIDAAGKIVRAYACYGPAGT